ncbi:hypothetical protein HPB50_014719 [Hyalomma asiaticum]|uniref:Uncharacterized protein n=1 Tax=Hyalomma asiaticum TaxID=266040 RepID=A0ACB7S6Q4_HYAAI|nr:hypothetical protein HPB50_014719 [Hyalomma asiaticum]
MASTARRSSVGSPDPSSMIIRSIDSDSVQEAAVKQQPWQLAFLASCFLVSVVVMMGFGAASVSGPQHRALPTTVGYRRGVGRARGALTWWYSNTNAHAGAATAATTTNVTIGDALPRLRSGDEDVSDQESSIETLRSLRHAANAPLLPSESANAGIQKLESEAAQQGAQEKYATDSTNPSATHLPSTPTAHGTRRVSPEGSTPVHYVLEIEPSLDEATNFSFNGTVTITFVCRKRTDKIALHAAAGLTVDVLNIVATFRSVQKPLRIDNTSRNVLEDLYHIRLREQLHRNERYNLTLRFSGTVGTEPKGLYRVGYIDGPGKRHKWALLTKMRPKYARRVFPCFDDPSVTASFDITIVHKKGVNAVSNMPVYRTERRTPDLVADTFARTPRIPTLLIALTLNDFPSFGKGTMRVWTRASATSLAQKLALDVVPKLLEHYEDYYETKYPMPKLDIVILSNCSIDTSGYFGLIFMKEPTFVLQSPRKTMARDALQRLSALAHAISAQVCFGISDIVILSNCSIDTSGYFGLIFMKEPTFVLQSPRKTMARDALQRLSALAHAISAQAGLELIYEVQDALYLDSLGTHYALSDEESIEVHAENPLVNINLKKDFLQSYRHERIHEDDIWRAFEKAENISGNPMDLTSIMHSWSRQDGYPLVTVKRFYASGTAKVSQCRYFLNEPRLENSNVWHIPITFSNGGPYSQFRDHTPVVWLSKPDGKLTDIPSNTTWLLLNLKAKGFYRVNYDKRNWMMLIEQLKKDHTAIPHQNRAQILNDIYDLARSGALQMSLAFSASRYLTKEREFLPWKAVFNAWRSIEKLLSDTNIFPSWKFTLRTVSFWIPRNQRGFVYCTAVQRGDYSDWKFVWDRFVEHAHEPGLERSELIWALSCSNNQRITRTLLRKTLNEKLLNVIDCVRIFTFVAERSVQGRDLTLDFIRKNWPSMFFKWRARFMEILIRIAAKMVNDQELDQVRNLFYNFNGTSAEVTWAFQLLDRNAAANRAWMASQYKQISKFLSEDERLSKEIKD